MTSITTPPRPWQRLFAVNQTNTSITAPIPTVTKPSGDGVIDLGPLQPPSIISLAFFGAGADDNTAVARVTGWKRCDQAGKTEIWIPTPLAALTLTLSTMTGVAGAAILDTDRFADIIAESTVYTSAKEILAAAAADNTLAIYNVDGKGHELIQVQVGTNSSATNVNALWSGF